jgi:tetratricopeptide (TPR) repeat protein
MTDQPQDNSELLSNLDEAKETLEDAYPVDYSTDTVEGSSQTLDEALDELPDDSEFEHVVPTRFEELTEAIARYPDAPANYVYRGELLLEEGHHAEAAADFAKALEVADLLAESANWGYIYRGLADRAREGLRRCPSL